MVGKLKGAYQVEKTVRILNHLQEKSWNCTIFVKQFEISMLIQFPGILIIMNIVINFSIRIELHVSEISVVIWELPLACYKYICTKDTLFGNIHFKERVRTNNFQTTYNINQKDRMILILTLSWKELKKQYFLKC